MTKTVMVKKYFIYILGLNLGHIFLYQNNYTKRKWNDKLFFHKIKHIGRNSDFSIKILEC